MATEDQIKAAGGWCAPSATEAGLPDGGWPDLLIRRGGIRFPMPVVSDDPDTVATWELVQAAHLRALEHALLLDNGKAIRRAARQILLHSRKIGLVAKRDESA